MILCLLENKQDLEGSYLELNLGFNFCNAWCGFSLINSYILCTIGGFIEHYLLVGLHASGERWFSRKNDKKCNTR